MVESVLALGVAGDQCRYVRVSETEGAGTMFVVFCRDMWQPDGDA